MRRPLPLVALVLLAIVLPAGCLPDRPEPSVVVPPTLPTVLATASPTVAPTIPPTPRTAPLLSAGDPYTPELGNSGYDVQHYTLRLALDPAAPSLEGQATIQGVVTLDRLELIALDFVGFDITALTLDGSPASFSRQGGKLLISPPAALSKDTPFRLAIAYGGQPVQEPSPYVPFVSHLGLHFQPDSNRLFVVAEPDGARYWFPANDHPRDKATFRFELLVPPGLTGVANGLLIESQPGVARAFPDGRSGDLFIWEHRYPMATAFATVAVGDYVLVEGTSPNGILLRHYVFPELQAAMEAQNALIGEMLDWLSSLLGPYPFEAFGYVTVAGLGGSLETQTMVILDEQGVGNEETLVHEMAHMWFGDWVSLDSWGDIWRSEGFATYFQFLWPARDDPTALEGVISELQQAIAANPSGYPLNAPPPRLLFGRDSYLRGALLAHALRLELGDEAFFEGLRAYFSRYGGGTASQEQFQAAMEDTAGSALADFFAPWFAP